MPGRCGVTPAVAKPACSLAYLGSVEVCVVAATRDLLFIRRATFTVQISRKYISRSRNELRRYIALAKSFPSMYRTNVSDQ